MPPRIRAREGSARQNLSKTRMRADSLSPGPKSRTPIATSLSVARMVTTISFPSAWSSALESKLRKMRSTRRISALIWMVGASGSMRIPESVGTSPNSKSATHLFTKLTTSKSTGSSTATSASKRLTSRRSSSNLSKRSIWAASSSELRATTGSNEVRWL